MARTIARPSERPRGRPPTPETDLVKVETRMTQESFAAFEEWRLGLPVIPPRAAALRTLIEHAMRDLKIGADL